MDRTNLIQRSGQTSVSTTMEGRVNLAALAGTSRAMEDASSLTPDALMIYCQTRLRSLDSEIQKAFDEQSKGNSMKAELAELGSKITMDPNGFNDQAKLDQYVGELQAEQAKVGANSPQGQEIQKMIDTLKSGGDSTVTSQEIASIQQGFKTIQSTYDSGSELQMIQLQSLMSQRQTAIQLTTNLIQTMNDTMQKVVGNVGH